MIRGFVVGIVAIAACICSVQIVEAGGLRFRSQTVVVPRQRFVAPVAVAPVVVQRQLFVAPQRVFVPQAFVAPQVVVPQAIIAQPQAFVVPGVQAFSAGCGAALVY